MTDTAIDDAVASYLNSLRTELADLPPAEVEEILDDVGPHLTEVAQELGDDDLPRRLAERLGAPAQYAAELRAAAGYPARPAGEAPLPVRVPAGGLRLALVLLVAATALAPLSLVLLERGGAAVLALLSVVALAALSLAIVLRRGGVRAFAELPEARWLRARAPGGAVAEYGRLLQPGWWLVRAGLGALLLVALFGAHPAGLLLLLIAVPLVLVSVWLGRRSQADRRWLWAVLPINAFAVAAGLLLADRVPNTELTYVDFGEALPSAEIPDRPAVPVPVPAFGNVFPFDANGNPLTGVFLYDENGRPISPAFPAGDCLPAGRVPVPANQYPQPVYRLDRTGACVPSPDAPTLSRPPTAAQPTTAPPTTAPPAAPPAPTPTG